MHGYKAIKSYRYRFLFGAYCEPWQCLAMQYFAIDRLGSQNGTSAILTVLVTFISPVAHLPVTIIDIHSYFVQSCARRSLSAVPS